MNPLPSIDLHPEKISGGAHGAVRACREFLDKALAAGHREVRVVTGLGLRGDGTPRLRTRIEQEVLGGFYSHIEHTAYEQGGAVIRIWLKASGQKPAAAWHRQQRRNDERLAVADREERLMVAWDRLQAADQALEEGDLRRCRLKLNQVAREFGWESAAAALDEDGAHRLLEAHRALLKALDA
jgi:Smr domain